MRFRMIIGIFVITLLAFFKLAEASYFPFNDTGSSSNLGIGTTSAFGGKLIVMGGNVGVGSLTPGSVLDIQGTSRATGFQLSTNPASGYVLVSGSTGIGTWMAASTLATSGGGASGWSTGSGTIYPTTITDNIGIGTNTPQGSLVVTNGNVGIGTWAPIARLDIRNSGNTYGIYSTMNSGGGVGYAIYGYLSSGASGTGVYGEHGGTSGKAVYGNASQQGGGAGIGVYGASAGSSTGTGVYAIQTHGSNVGYALAASNNSANGWTIYALGTSPNYFASNVGLGTIRPNAALSVVGNVGIGTGINSPFLVASPPSGGMIVEGNVGIGTTTPQTKLSVLGNVGIGTWTSALAALSFGKGTTLASGINFGNDTTLYRSDVGTLTTDGFLVSGYSYAVGYVVTPSLKGGFFPSENLTLDSTNDGTKGNVLINPTGGNIGIGTTLAPSRLSVKGALSQIVITLSDAATIATDASLANHFRVTLGGNRTLGNPTNVTDGQRVVWELIQDGTGSRTITLDTKFALGTDITAVTLTTTASKRDFLTAIYNLSADKWYVVGFVKGY